MKILTLLVTLLFAGSAFGQSDVSSLIISNEIKSADAQKEALRQAKELTQKNIENLKLEINGLEKTEIKQTNFSLEKTSSAPFGLLWGASKEHIQYLGVALKEYNVVDHPDSYLATNLPVPIKDVENVILSFGEDDKLWRILADTKAIKNNNSASEILFEYKKYYNLLKKKYGNAKQTFIPYKIKVMEKNIEKQIAQPIGNQNFLEQLKNGSAQLYATFYNKEVASSLSISIDENAMGYLMIEYKNIHLYNLEEKDLLNAL